MLKIINVVGARPNFMKAAPVIQALRMRKGWDLQLVHTDQHYDEKLSRIFFDELGLPKPDLHLGVGSGTHRALPSDDASFILGEAVQPRSSASGSVARASVSDSASRGSVSGSVPRASVTAVTQVAVPQQRL